ncbi:MAG: lysophospholipid acyltransferase family protein [Isosphaeraceae bacterium]
MSVWVLSFLAILLLCLPTVILPGKPPEPRPEAAPEIDASLRAIHWVMIAYCALWHRLKNNGWAPLPESGGAILIANHTCGIDHVLLQASSRRVLGFIIAREYYEWNLIHWFCWRVGCIPVNRDGRDLQAIRAALRALQQGRVVPIFPEGRITPASGRELGEMLPGAAYLALRAGVPVYPAYIRGTPETNQIGPSLKTPSHSSVTFGPPIDLSDLGAKDAGDKEAQAEVSRRFRAALLDLQGRSRNRSAYRYAGLSEPVPLD